MTRARPDCPERSRSSVCRLNDEKVVNPPHTPTMTNRRASSGMGKRPCDRVSVPNPPIRNEPKMLIRIVPQGVPWLIGRVSSESP